MLLVVNDHLLKGSGLLPGGVTGKLSDGAGLVVAPVLLAAMVGARRPRAVITCFAAVAVWFVVINTSTGAAAGWEQLTATLGLPWRCWCDPSDLLALPALALGWWLVTVGATGVKATPWSAWRRAARLGAMVVGALACMATSRALPPPAVALPDHVMAQAWGNAPLWIIDEDDGRVLGKLDASGWIGPTAHVGDVFYALGWRGLTGTEIPSGESFYDYELKLGRFQATLATDRRRLFVVTAPRHRQDREVLVALDGLRPQRLWKTSLPSKRLWRSRAHALVCQAGLLLVPAANRLLAVDPVTGAVLWTYRAETELHWPWIMGTHAYVATVDGDIVALDLERGDERWRYATRVGDAFALRPWRARPLGGALGVLLYADGRSLVAIDGLTGAFRWRQEGVEDAVIGESAVFTKLGSSSYAVVDSVDGRQRWRLELDDLESSRPVLDEARGAVFLRTHGGLLHARDLGTGVLRWTVDLQDGAAVVEGDAGRVLVGPWAR